MIGQPGPGQRWRLVSATVSLASPVPCAHAQHIFLWTEFLKAPGLPNPNQDFLAHARVEPGREGSFGARGGYDASVEGVYHYTRWTQAIRLVPGTGVKFDSDAPVGNTARYEAVFELEEPAISDLRFHYSFPQDGSPQTVPVGGPSAGTYWRLEFATVGLTVGGGASSRTARLVRRPDGATLAELTRFTPSRPRSNVLDATAGYSTEQTGPSSGGRGSQTVWLEPVYVGSGESLEVQFEGPPGDKGHYAVAASRLPGSRPG